ncbi:alpha-ribazole phosphatase [Halanaerobacter jeridensis]|uniref:Alpha-ribazole phosphatase n=1 Tax=Halanaerobacter jeridensis TaxID=706427 RepID=A0A939BM15_9FIRM|nr:alpha-ribazole phosphatase [Halanaerobacter jeridensis]MBM7555395.1 alpha-ribazole phosphatase [Halanaerobacter jeridensis]
MVTKLILVRHGETDWNKEARFQGNKNVALNQNGEKQAHKLAKRLANEKIDVIYSSDLDRAYKTAKIIAALHKLPIQQRSNLQEIDFGVWEGLTYEEIKEHYPKQFELWDQNPKENGPEQGESLKDIERRVFETIEEILDEHQGQTILVTAHGGVNRVIISNFLEMPLEKCWRLNQANTAVNIINIYQSEIILESFNSIYHLRSDNF